MGGLYNFLFFLWKEGRRGGGMGCNSIQGLRIAFLFVFFLDMVTIPNGNFLSFFFYFFYFLSYGGRMESRFICTHTLLSSLLPPFLNSPWAPSLKSPNRF